MLGYPPAWLVWLAITLWLGAFTLLAIPVAARGALTLIDVVTPGGRGWRR